MNLKRIFEKFCKSKCKNFQYKTLFMFIVHLKHLLIQSYNNQDEKNYE